MPHFPQTSRRRFRDYLASVRQRRAGGNESPGATKGPPRAAQQRSFWKLFTAFLGMLRGQRLAIAFALGTLTVSSLLSLVPPAATKFVIDYVLSGHALPERLARLLPASTGRVQLLLLVAGAVAALTFVEIAIHLVGRWHATRATKRVQTAVRRRVFEHAVRLPLNRVWQLKSGGVASILREDAGGIAELVFSMLYNPWRAVIQFLGSLLILAWIDWRLLLGGLLLGPVVWITHSTWIKRIRPLHKDIRNLRQEIDGHATESFGGMRVVRAFGRQRSEAGRFARSNHLMARQELHAWWWARGVELAWDVIVPLASAALLLYGGWRVLEGALTLGDLMMFLVYLAMLLGPLAVLANSATQLQSSLAGLERVLDLLEEPLEMPPLPGAASVQAGSVAGRIELIDVSFHYPGASEDVLRNIHLEARAGETIALVGPSGAGKTTLCNLVARFYDPTAGRIELDGVDLRELEVDSFRKLLGIVEQDVFLFDGTVAENIGYARRGASMEEIRRAAQIAHAAEFIERMERGYDTVIGERGVRLSGGQRQRLAIARALLADPRILILDEATSNLDTESEQLIQRGLIELMRGRTCFVIAHRLSTIRHADRIVVLESGRIVEQGTHDDLLAAGGRYREMVERQIEGSCVHSSSNGSSGTSHTVIAPS